MKTLILAAAIALAGCSTEGALRKVQPPTVVTKIVEKHIDLPGWAVEQLPNKAPANGSVEAMKDANNARAGTLDYVNCRSRLLAKLDKGEKVTGKECRKP